MTPWRLKLWANWWPPFLFGGIRVLHVADDWRSARVQLKRTCSPYSAAALAGGGQPTYPVGP